MKKELNDKEFAKVCSEAFNKLNADTSALLFVTTDEEGGLMISQSDNNDSRIINGISQMISYSILNPMDDSEQAAGAHRLTEIIIKSLIVAETENPAVGLSITRRLVQASVENLKETIKEIFDKEDEKECEDWCKDCDLLRECNEQDAIKYRKAHGIPRPKKSNGKKK